MNKKHSSLRNNLFWIFLAVILVFGILIKVVATSENRIFFTVDQGRDAVYAREIINYHTIFTKGPQATLTGLYTGPLWYYFISIGYLLIHGNPVGAVWFLTLVNIATTAVLVIIIKKEINWKIALIVAFSLQIFWNFFTISLWAFNPFILVPLTIILILLLVKNKYALAVIPIILAFNSELAGAIALFFFYISYGFWMTITKKINWKKFLLFALAIPTLAITKTIFDFLKTPRNPSPTGSTKLFSGTNFHQIGIEFIKIIGSTAIPQSPILGFLLVISIIIVFIFFIKNKNSFTKKFFFLLTALTFVCFIFFGSGHFWSAWHTAFLAPLFFICILIISWNMKVLGKAIIAIILFLQLISFKTNLQNYLKPSPNPSLLSNELKVLDWVYNHNEGNGFNLYTYTNTFYDYTYQYLIYWYALPKYGFYPCEYSNFPLSHKYLYIPGANHYVSPQLGCDKFRFLIIDSNTNGEKNKDWIKNFKNQTILLESTRIGNTTVEKRKVPDKIKS